MVPKVLALHLALLAGFGASAPTATTTGQDRLFKLVARVVQQPTRGDLPNVEGYYVSSAAIGDNSREIVLIPQSGDTTQDGEHIVPENYYTNSSALTVRQSLTAADAQRPYTVDLFPWAASPAGYSVLDINYSSGWNDTEVYTVAADQPYFGINNPPNNYDVADPTEGHFVACDIDEGVGPRIQVYVRTGITDADGDPGECADIRLLPECAGDFAGDAPENVKLSSCYADASTAPLPRLSN